MAMEPHCGIDEERGGLLNELTTGFGILLEKVEELAARNARFEQQIRMYQAEGREQYTPTKISFMSSDVGDVVDIGKAHVDWHHDPKVDRGIQAWRLLKAASSGAVPLQDAPGRGNVPQGKADDRAIYLDTKADRNHMEWDFTTHGKQGKLGCPFPAMAEQNLRTDNREIKTTTLDARIKSTTMDAGYIPSSTNVEVQASPGRDPLHSPTDWKGHKSGSVNGSATKCPIRYLDQMPTEEVAKYFESHKHEIPRSHEVCVKRYQANEDSIRSLDAKYGSLVKMIEGLGEKHKPMLPSELEQDEEEEDALKADQKSIEKVEKWAEDCVDGAGPLMKDGMESDGRSEARTGHFERPLREVRLGESPSRPWGIQVPLTEQLALSSDAPEISKPAAQANNRTLDEDDEEDVSSVLATGGAAAAAAEPAKKRCPFHHHGAGLSPHLHAHVPEHRSVQHESTRAVRGVNNDNGTTTTHEVRSPEIPLSLPFQKPPPISISTPIPKNDGRRAGNESPIHANANANAKPKVEAGHGRGHGQGQGQGQGNRPIVFSGPVFFGYSADEAARFMEALRQRRS